jgi:hypothetical protein
MARFNFIHYLFAIFVVLAMVAHARPASSDPDTDTVAGMPGMSKKPGVAMSGEDKKDSTPEADSEEEYMEDMKEAISAAAKVCTFPLFFSFSKWRIGSPFRLRIVDQR